MPRRTPNKSKPNQFKTWVQEIVNVLIMVSKLIQNVYLDKNMKKTNGSIWASYCFIDLDFDLGDTFSDFWLFLLVSPEGCSSLFCLSLRNIAPATYWICSLSPRFFSFLASSCFSTAWYLARLNRSKGMFRLVIIFVKGSFVFQDFFIAFEFHQKLCLLICYKEEKIHFIWVPCLWFVVFQVQDSTPLTNLNFSNPFSKHS